MAGTGEVAAMRRALLLAATPRVRPGANPRVGCVLLGSNGDTVGEGYHRGAGTPHAEVEALRAAGARARGGTAVVTLEPCDHQGRTGPCTDALVQAGVVRVVFAQSDVDPVAAGGAAAMSRADIDVEGGVLADEAHAMNLEWTAATLLGRPHVTWKYAATLDGRSSAADGSSRWITGTQSRRDVHERRRLADAVVAGTGTVLADDAQLSARDGSGTPLPRELQPLRVVVGRRELPSSARILDASAPTLHLRDHSPAQALGELWERGVRRVLLEGGPTLAGAFWRAGLVDRVVAYVAPMLLGAGPTALAAAGITTLADAVRLEITDVARCGDDVRLIALPRWRNP